MKKVEIDHKKNVKKLKKGVSDFKVFISRGNVVDMAVGVIIGGAFGKIVSSLVSDAVMPLIGILLGGLDFSELSITVQNAHIKYGLFIQTIVDFLIISFSIFVVIKIFEKFKKQEEPVVEEASRSDEAILLEEIRDLLKDKK